MDLEKLIADERGGDRHQLGMLSGFKQQLPDADPVETQEWIDALDDVVRAAGPERADFLLRKVLKRARQLQHRTAGARPVPVHQHDLARAGAAVPRRRGHGAAHPPHHPLERGGDGGAREPPIGGDRRPSVDVRVGGEPLRSRLQPLLPRQGRRYWETRSSTRVTPRLGIYARAFLEGRLTEAQLDHFRREVVRGQGLSSYPHPRLMPDFWEFPTVSMGLGPINAIYQARFNRYLHARGLADTSRSRVWAFLGDGECDEPEALGALTLASREGPRQPDVRRELQPPASRRSGARQRQGHPGARGRVHRRRLERDQGDLGARVGRAARRGLRRRARRDR